MGPWVGQQRVAIDELRNPFAALASGEIVHVGHIRSRQEGPFTCPECGTPLLLRMGEIRQRHFAHEAGAICESPLETFLHKWAKQIIESEKRLRLPALWVTADMERMKAIEARLETFDGVEPEVGQGDFRPDLVCYRTVDGVMHRLFVEIRVTHAVDSAKRRKITAAGNSAIEIDLRKCNLMDADALKEAILDTAPRDWLFHRRSRELTERFRRTVAERRKAEQRQERVRRIADAEAAIAAGEPRRLTVAQVDRLYAQRDLREAVARAFPTDGAPSASSTTGIAD